MWYSDMVNRGIKKILRVRAVTAVTNMTYGGKRYSRIFRMTLDMNGYMAYIRRNVSISGAKTFLPFVTRNIPPCGSFNLEFCPNPTSIFP